MGCITVVYCKADTLSVWIIWSHFRSSVRLKSFSLYFSSVVFLLIVVLIIFFCLYVLFSFSTRRFDHYGPSNSNSTVFFTTFWYIWPIFCAWVIMVRFCDLNWIYSASCNIILNRTRPMFFSLSFQVHCTLMCANRVYQININFV